MLWFLVRRAAKHPKRKRMSEDNQFISLCSES